MKNKVFIAVIIFFVFNSPAFSITPPNRTNVSPETELQLLKLFNTQLQENYKILKKNSSIPPFISMQKIFLNKYNRKVFIVKAYTGGTFGDSYIVYSLEGEKFRIILPEIIAQEIDLQVSPNQDKLIIQYHFHGVFCSGVATEAGFKVHDLQHNRYIYESPSFRETSLAFYTKAVKWLNNSQIEYLEITAKSQKDCEVFEKKKKMKYKVIDLKQS